MVASAYRLGSGPFRSWLDLEETQIERGQISLHFDRELGSEYSSRLLRFKTGSSIRLRSISIWISSRFPLLN